MGSNAHDKILSDAINDQKAVVVTAKREPSGIALHSAIISRYP